MGKESTLGAGVTGDMGLIPGSRRSPGGGQGDPLQYSCLENPIDRGAWQATVHGVEGSDTIKATEHTCVQTRNKEEFSQLDKY